MGVHGGAGAKTKENMCIIARITKKIELGLVKIY